MRPRRIGSAKPGRRRRARAIAAGLVAPAAAVGASAGAAGVALARPLAPEPGYPSVATVKDVVAELAARNGAPSLTTMTVFRTDRAQANRAVDVAAVSGTAGLEPASVVYVPGAFVGLAAKVPPLAPLPTGRVLVVVLNSSGEVTDWGLHQSMPSARFAAAMGPATTYRLVSNQAGRTTG